MTADETRDTPPSESVWTKYSPNHELPIAGTSSLVIHALLAAAIVLAGLALNARWHSEAALPPKVDVAYIAAAPGDGLPPGGGSPKAAGGGTERVDVNPMPSVIPETPNITKIEPITPTAPATKIDIPIIGEAPKEIDFEAEILKIQGKIPTETKRPGVPGGNPGGQGGGGTGTGKGSGTGPGVGTGGVPGGKAARADILAQRWRFNLSGSPSEHVQKLIAIGMTVGFMDGKGQFFQIVDLSKRPVTYAAESFDRYKDTVKWASDRPESVLGVTAEIGLPHPPARFILLLPKDREQVIADAELQFARSRNRDLSKVQETWIDFQLRGGQFVPVVIGQVPYDPRPKW